MNHATDVHYQDNTVQAAGLVFPDWKTADIHQKILKPISKIVPYEPGTFYKRELPCLLAVVEALEQIVDAIIVDGYVTLGNDEKSGLGALQHA